MPPRRSARVAAVAERESSALAPLPLSLVLAIFALLPVDQRLLCRAVCRGWRAVLGDVSLWLRLDLSAESGVASRMVTDALLQAAAARAGGSLLSLTVMDCPAVTREALLAVATASAVTLREARLCLGALGELSCEQLEALVRTAPLLRTLHADVTCTAAEARRLLRNEPPFEALRVRRLAVSTFEAGGEVAMLALAADMTTHDVAHASLQELCLFDLPLNAAAVMDALVQAALTCRLRRLDLLACRLSPASAPALARLLGGGALTTLQIYAGDVLLLDEPAALLLGAALRANTTLTSLFLYNTRLWQEPAAGVALLNALTAHRSLCELDLDFNAVGAAQQQAGAALGTLIAANAPTLQSLKYYDSGLGDAGLGPLVDALQHNTHLRTLHCIGHGASAAFVRERLLPAVRADLRLQE
jgi:hypothetical protein